MKNKKINKILIISALSTSLLVNPIIGSQIPTNAYAAEVETGAQKIVVGNVTLTSSKLSIDSTSKDGSGLIFSLEWLKESKVDVLQIDLVVTNGTIVSTSLDPSSYSIKEDGKRVRLLIDKRLDAVELFVKADNPKENNANVTAKMDLGYSGEANNYEEDRGAFSFDIPIVEKVVAVTKEEDKGIPTQSTTDKQKTEKTPTNEEKNSIDTSSKNPTNKKSQKTSNAIVSKIEKKNQGMLPQAGEKRVFIYGIAGIIIIGLTILVYSRIKNKEKR
ncbi:LPXTG cell wall anchor domain-containing protein [Carnobacterium gallinarum]|uniref:LPXTG cell wall anchor domain-containing protein n=1 Tax=Carnobacterium gallinarum TaxID=2749 RepID=UPI000550002B|nr:LPXTG cell wall anchor domain-containing protein [Carnobacterium gallinarum]